MALGALAANRGRSILTVLSITIGAFAIVLMSSLADSGLETLARGIEDLGGARILMVFPKTPERAAGKQFAYASGMNITDRDRTFEDLPHVRAVSLFSTPDDQEIIAESGARTKSSVVASDERFFSLFHMKLARGRLFTDEENRGREAVCIVGPKLVDKLGGLEDPLGRMLTVGPLRCRVIGLLADNERFGVSFGFEWNDLVVVPSETFGDAYAAARSAAHIIVQTDAPSSNDLVKRIVNARLSRRHPGVDDFSIFDLATFMTEWDSVNRVMGLIVAVLAGIALFVGGVGVMNMMLVAVSERVREIGIRKALGAPPRSISAQFLTEAVLLSALGGVAGVTLGLGVAVGAAALIRHSVKTWQLSLAPVATVSALLVTMAIGVVFGWLPAKRAAALDPIEAMRR